MAAFIDSLKRYCGGSSVLAGFIIANTVIFLAVWIVTLIGRHFGLEGNFTMPWLCVASSPADVMRHPWTLLTYMVTQYDFIHLLFNVLWLFWFGVFIPFTVSEKRRFMLYVGGGLTGAIFYVATNLLLNPSAIAPGFLCGASAAVLGVMTAVAIWEPKREIRLLFFGGVQMRWIAIICIALTFFGMNGGSWAAQSAHLGGVIFGAIFAMLTRGAASTASYTCSDYFSRSGHTSRQDSSNRGKTPKRSIRLNVKRDGKAVADAAEHLSDTGRLDVLLDKIRISGYSSLSAGERNELMLLSQRLKNNNSE